jgi:hypothetical protein
VASEISGPNIQQLAIPRTLVLQHRLLQLRRLKCSFEPSLTHALGSQLLLLARYRVVTLDLRFVRDPLLRRDLCGRRSRRRPGRGGGSGSSAVPGSVAAPSRRHRSNPRSARSPSSAPDAAAASNGATVDCSASSLSARPVNCAQDSHESAVSGRRFRYA